MDILVYLGLSILEINKTVMYEFCYDYVKPEYGEKTKLCYMDIYSFIVYIKTEDIYLHIVKDDEKWLGTTNYELDRPLPKRKNKESNWFNGKWIRWESNEIICCIKSKKYSYLTENNDEDKKSKDKKVCHKKKD